MPDDDSLPEAGAADEAAPEDGSAAELAAGAESGAADYGADAQDEQPFLLDSQEFAALTNPHLGAIAGVPGVVGPLVGA